LPLILFLSFQLLICLNYKQLTVMPYFSVIIFLLVFSKNILAQYVFNDTAIYNSAVKNAAATTKNVLQNNFLLYKGPLYFKVAPYAKGFPFLYADSFATGSVVFNNIAYQDILLQYDIEADELIVRNYEDNNSIKLPNSKVSRFTIYGQLYQRLPSSVANGDSSFYQLLYATNGGIQAFVKRIKILERPKEIHETLPTYIQQNRMYFLVNNQLFTIQKPKDIVKALVDKKEQLKNYFKEKQIKILTDESIIAIVKYYDAL
jgi:hypothetical protein